MKTIYLIKSFVPFLFLPLAPGVLQVELERQGLITAGSTTTFFTIMVQVAFAFAVIAWLAHTFNRKTKTKAFLKMSCVSKKVYHNGQWMSVEQYLAEHHNVVVSHGMTPEEATVWMRESEEWLEKEAKSYAKTEVGVS